ncbi:MAG: tetratricopeptide repeat protein [Pirellulaceae bacterium]
MRSQHHKQALEITKSTQGEQHPDYAASLNNLAWLYRYQAKPGRGEPLFRPVLSIQRQVLDRNAGIESNRQQMANQANVKHCLSSRLSTPWHWETTVFLQ